MKNTENKIQNTFLQLLQTEPIDKITVLKICKILKIKRQTFYYHYQSIYDLILSIFYINRIEIDENLTFEKNIRLLELFLSENELLCKAILDTFAENILLEYINSFVYRLLEVKSNKLQDSKQISKFYSKSIGNFILDLYKTDNFKADILIKELKNIISSFKYILI